MLALKIPFSLEGSSAGIPGLLAGCIWQVDTCCVFLLFVFLLVVGFYTPIIDANEDKQPKYICSSMSLLSPAKEHVAHSGIRCMPFDVAVKLQLHFPDPLSTFI